jgi:type I restriction enzyme S subunit
MSEKETLPEGWEVKKLEEIADVKTGPFGSALHASDYVKSGTPIISVEHLGEHSIMRQNLPLVSDEDNQRLCAYVLQEGDIVFSRVGSVDRNAYVSKHENGWLFSGRLLRIRSTSEDFDTKYLGYYFKFESVKAQIRNIAVGQTMASLNTKLLNTFEIILPPLPEQRAIAAVLSDMDSYIASLEKLIAKKKAVKQGAMQELLTGKRRLPGFAGEEKLPEGWKIEKLGNLVTIVSGGTPRTSIPSYWNGGILWCTPTDITKNKSKYIKSTEKTITSDGLSESAATLLPEGAILLCTRATIGEMCIAVKQMSTNQGFKNLICNDDVSNEFLFYVLSTKKQKMIELAIGSTFLEISKTALSSIKLIIPIEKKEQSAIIAVLSDMDAEIDALSARLNKTKLIKQGMMRELLTGRIRLSDNLQGDTKGGA